MTRSDGQIARRRTIVIVALLVAIAVAVLSSVMSEDKGETLPISGGKVTSDNPLTSPQAAEVRQVARALTVDLVDRLVADPRSIDTDRSDEAWTTCTAEQKDLFQTTYNGIYYHASIFTTAPGTASTADIRAQVDDLGVTWDRDRPERGERGLFTVVIPTGESLYVEVSSPCYFLRSTGGENGSRSDDTLKVTGFVNQPWTR